MKKQKITAHYGLLLVIIIALTVGVFIFQYEKNKFKLGEQSVNQQPAEKKAENNQNLETTENINWQTFKNNKYDFRIQYPSNFFFDENLIDGPEYSINFGPSYGETLGKDHSARKAVRSFEISIYKNEGNIDGFIKKQNAARLAVEQRSESVGIENVAGVSAKVIKACDMGGYCNKIIYLNHKNYIFSIYIKNYFTLNDQASKEQFDRMLASFEFFPE